MCIQHFRGARALDAKRRTDDDIRASVAHGENCCCCRRRRHSDTSVGLSRLQRRRRCTVVTTTRYSFSNCPDTEASTFHA